MLVQDHLILLHCYHRLILFRQGGGRGRGRLGVGYGNNILIHRGCMSELASIERQDEAVSRANIEVLQDLKRGLQGGTQKMTKTYMRLKEMMSI